jgi:hypothetical protein
LKLTARDWLCASLDTTSATLPLCQAGFTVNQLYLIGAGILHQTRIAESHFEATRAYATAF